MSEFLLENGDKLFVPDYLPIEQWEMAGNKYLKVNNQKTYVLMSSKKEK